ncbi:CCA tRNA nucleotidyltransferase, partial [Candidatus Poribacteria bacterium]|nr:CCA tRNA nucleotidyltransferase [Candidatus Poribacteria bacterium]
MIDNLKNHSKILPQILTLLQAIGQAGEQAARPVYVVGGFVRDLLLGRENLDLDIVVEGDAIRFARHLAEAWGGTFQAHHQFGTGTLTRPDGFKIDFVTARRETYERPGALPFVESGTIEDDLRRRDFSMNALAIQLNPDAFGNLVDCTDGLRDLRAGLLRTLHDRSFMDDPTRIFRAIRYEGRYEFQIVDSDQMLIREAIHQSALDLISGERIRNEIDRILLEGAAPKMIRRMLEFDLFRAIHPAWEVPQDFDALWNAAHRAMDWAAKHLVADKIDATVMLWMTVLGTATPVYVIEAITDRLVLAHQLQKLFRIESEFQRDLEDRVCSEDLRRAFENHGISLSQNVTIKAESGKWLITDKEKEQAYAIRKEKRQLNIYQIQTKLVAPNRLRKTLDALSPASRPSEVYQLLKPYPLEALVFALTQPDQPDWRVAKIRNYLIDLKDVQPLINGDDLIQLGLKPSPAFA